MFNAIFTREALILEDDDIETEKLALDRIQDELKEKLDLNSKLYLDSSYRCKFYSNPAVDLSIYYIDNFEYYPDKRRRMKQEGVQSF